jgi:formylglycine-generating enzyme required for sulfatase activity
MTASCTVTVYSGAVTGVTLNNETLALGVNGTGSLTATVMPANAINKAVNWSSSRPEVATVAGSGTNNLTGTVTGVANGQTTITVTTADGGFTATCVVTVTTVFVTGVTVSPTAYDLMSNYLLPMDATVTPTNAYNRNVTWSSSNPDVVFISDTSTSFNWGTLPARRAYARSLGTATITATTVGLKENGQPATASCVINVVPHLDGFVTVPAGTFQMGSPTSESGRSNNETQHTVTISKGFYMSESPVTQAQYMRVMGYNPSFWDYRLEAAAEQTYWSKSPADSMTWFDAIEYCNNLSVRENLTPVYTINNRQPATGYPIHGLAVVNGEWDIVTTVTANWSANGYRLPTEAEWELACRAGARTAYNVPDRNSSGLFTSYGKYTLIPPTLDANFNITDLGDANFDGGSIYRSIGYSLPVKEAYDYGNYYGLYGMHGNVTEWCWDAWDYTTAYAAGSVTDPKGLVNPPDNYPRVMRGGSYAHGSAWVRSAKRDAGYPCDDGYEVGGYLEPLNGFRVVRNYAVTGGSSSPSLKTLPQSESAPKMVGGTRSMESIEWSRMVRKARTVPQNKRVIDKFIPPMKRGDFRKE